jgi:hypothetical protein
MARLTSDAMPTSALLRCACSGATRPSGTCSTPSGWRPTARSSVARSPWASRGSPERSGCSSALGHGSCPTRARRCPRPTWRSARCSTPRARWAAPAATPCPSPRPLCRPMHASRCPSWSRRSATRTRASTSIGSRRASSGRSPLRSRTPRVCASGVTSLRGAWDRVRFLHAGSARSLREVLLTPGHPGRLPGERARNERDGVPNTHGGTGHLDAREIEALAAFLETL